MKASHGNLSAALENYERKTKDMREKRARDQELGDLGTDISIGSYRARLNGAVDGRQKQVDLMVANAGPALEASKAYEDALMAWADAGERLSRLMGLT